MYFRQEARWGLMDLLASRLGAKGEAMEIKRSGSQPPSKRPAEWFSRDVAIDPLFEAPEPARVRGRALHSSQVLARHGTPIL